MGHNNKRSYFKQFLGLHQLIKSSKPIRLFALRSLLSANPIFTDRRLLRCSLKILNKVEICHYGESAINGGSQCHRWRQTWWGHRL